MTANPAATPAATPGATALAIGREIETGACDPRALTEAYLDAIAAGDPDARTYYRVTAARARAEADAARARAKAGLRRSPLDGVPVSWKDLFDTAGDETPAGSRMLAGRVPARDAAAVARATQAGMICLGKTAMTELAFSGLGINPVMGTPRNAADRAIARAPGGSSSGAAAALAAGLCAASLGTDTGGSVRIPAAWHGLVGYKPSRGLISAAGVVPLCPSLDTVGPIARDVADAAALAFTLAGRRAPHLGGEALRGRTVLVPDDGVWDGMDAGIAETVEYALRTVSRAGADVLRVALPEIAEMNRLTWDAGLSLAAVEAWSVWGDTIEVRGHEMFAPVRARFEGGRDANAAEAHRLVRRRTDLRRALAGRLAGADAVALPSVAIDPPRLETVEAGGPAYDRANRLALRNTTLANQLDLCAITLPAGASARGLPVGLMLMAPAGRDARLLRIAHAVEAVHLPDMKTGDG